MEMLNAKMLQTGSYIIYRWRLREPNKGRLGGTVLKGIWKFRPVLWGCSV